MTRDIHRTKLGARALVKSHLRRRVVRRDLRNYLIQLGRRMRKRQTKRAEHFDKLMTLADASSNDDTVLFDCFYLYVKRWSAIPDNLRYRPFEEVMQFVADELP